MPYIETSAKDPPLNVDAAFHEVVRVIRYVQQSDEISREVKRFGDLFDLCSPTFVAQNMSNIVSPMLQRYTVYSVVNFNEVPERSKCALSMTAVFKFCCFFVNREQPVEPQVKLRKRRFNFRQKDRQKCTLM